MLVMLSPMKTYRKLWKDPPCLMGKSTISMAMFYVANCKRLPAGMFVDEVPKKPQKSPYLQCKSPHRSP
jgi:hypothetical protein